MVSPAVDGKITVEQREFELERQEMTLQWLDDIVPSLLKDSHDVAVATRSATVTNVATLTVSLGTVETAELPPLEPSSRLPLLPLDV